MSQLRIVAITQSDNALNLVGTKAASANVHLAGGTVYQYGNLLYIGSP